MPPTDPPARARRVESRPPGEGGAAAALPGEGNRILRRKGLPAWAWLTAGLLVGVLTGSAATYVLVGKTPERIQGIDGSKQTESPAPAVGEIIEAEELFNVFDEFYKSPPKALAKYTGKTVRIRNVQAECQIREGRAFLVKYPFVLNSTPIRDTETFIVIEFKDPAKALGFDNRDPNKTFTVTAMLKDVNGLKIHFTGIDSAIVPKPVKKK